jgi:hypothetical protein
LEKYPKDIVISPNGELLALAVGDVVEILDVLEGKIV